MTAADNLCEVCGAEPMVGVAAVPGVPMSVAYGRNCLQHGATPLWIADVQIGQIMPVHDLDWRYVADWFREETVYVGGEYVRVDSLTLIAGRCEPCGGSGQATEEIDGAKHAIPCPAGCMHGRVAALQEAVDARAA